MLVNNNNAAAENKNMKTYTFHSSVPEAMRDSITLTLRKDGFQASRETDTLRTDATQAQIALSSGKGWVVTPVPATSTLKRVQELLAEAQRVLGAVEWNTAQVDNGPLGEHLVALEKHIDNAIGRCSTVARAASKL